MNIETERKFLVKDDSYKKDIQKSYEISQGYIARDGGNTVRVRILDGKGVLWYNDMKFYLCGRIIGPEWFE